MLAAVIVLAIISKTTASRLDICDAENSVDLSAGTHKSNGDIYLKSVKYKQGEYFLDNVTGIERGCICKKELCIRKCCGLGYAYNMAIRQCVNTADVFDPPIWDEYKLLKNKNASDLFHFVIGKPPCTGSEARIRMGQATKHHHLRDDGQLYIELPGSIPPWTLREPDKYCVDTFVTETSTGEKQTHLDALVCFAEEQGNTHYALSSSCMFISCVFILATCAVYAWLPELRNLHGRVLVSYLLCLFVAFIFMATMQILLTLQKITRDYCLTMTFVIYFFFESAIFWLNVMCFDIWWTFSGKRGLSLEKLSTRARFYAYALYAFGIPTVLTCLLAGLEFSGLPPHPLLPMLRYQGCFIYGNSRLLYLYTPVVVLCVANLVFFILTATKITQIKRQTSVLKSKESSTHDQRNDKQRLFLYIKLFIVMGVNWLLEVISAIYPKGNEFWKVTDAYNVLIGLTIFIIFVCKRKIFRLIKKRLGLLDDQPISSEGRGDKLKMQERQQLCEVYKQLRGDPMSRTQTTISSRTMSTRDEIPMGSVKIHTK